MLKWKTHSFYTNTYNHELPQSLIDNFKIEQRNYLYSTRTSRYNTLIVPNINTKKYGESSVIYQSYISWHYFSCNLQNPNLQNTTISQLKELVQNFLLNSYK